MVRRHLSLLSLSVFAVSILVLLLTYTIWMSWMGAFLVHADTPSHADFIVVLAGDLYGNRILRGAELVKQGYASKVLVSGPAGIYGLHECDLAIQFVVSHGYPASWFIPVPHSSHSTEEEGRAIFPVLQELQAHTVLVVTSDYHTRRAFRTLHRQWPGIDIHMIAAGDEFFSPDGWWHNREGRKTFLLEWSKTFATALGM